MFWEQLTGDEFPQAVQQVQGVCLLPLSCFERHGHHLPLATDMYIGRETCRRAALIEPVIIFPDNIYTQILEARHVPGTIAFDPELILKVLDNACREIARNGLHKIVLVSSHGGNNSLVRVFLQFQLAHQRNYVVYEAHPWLDAEDEAEYRVEWTADYGGHADEFETSAILAIHPELVQMEKIPADDEGRPQGRVAHLRQRSIGSGFDWYADHPTHYAGDARFATAEKGNRVLDGMARSLARKIALIKADEVTPHLQDEFHRLADKW